eukprot:TRINITY_DN3031_c1_g2_i2.p1 TRINITY_DN3031_c1_g2~~TRINITY_DN3031_c1_g2_i2.p1  ORF type:complete len:528 (+),score=107.36 TRINITY_DN3031_c1_g2_i2:106-1689(+)
MEDLRIENEKLKKRLEEIEGKLHLMEADMNAYSYRDEDHVDDGVLSIIVLGASGDLAKKKTFPALWALFREGLLPNHTAIFGFARHKYTDDEFREFISQNIKSNDTEKLNQFKKLCYYHTTPSYSSVEAFKDLVQDSLSKHEAEAKGSGNRLFYLALPPNVFVEVCTAIKQGAMTSTGWNRVIVEKPFGHDLESSTKLSKSLGALFQESQIYRIDHYLGKEMVQNLMVLRFANTVFEPMWNRHHIQNVRIVFKEDFGTQGRGGYFDKYGIIRDVMQNHLMQIFSLLAMEPPVTLGAEDVRDEKVKLLRAVSEIKPEHVITGQYVKDKSGKNEGYKDDKSVPRNSVTPTFAQAIVYINNQRWSGVPFILKTAKAVEERKAEIRIQFRKTHTMLFPEAQPNELVIRIQPSEAIYLKTMNKTPGLSSKLVISDMDLTYNNKFTTRYTPDAYERLILDAVRGDHNLFVRVDELAEAWRIFTPILHFIDAGGIKPIEYEYGSRGPTKADEIAKAVAAWEQYTYDWSAKEKKQ